MEDYNEVWEDTGDVSEEYTEGYTEEGWEDTSGYAEDSREDAEEVSEEDTPEEGSADQEADIQERLDTLLEQIGQTDYGSMGDYYIKEIGCYSYPDEDVFHHFVDAESEGAGWMQASNGCYVPVEYLEDYESYITGDTGTEEEPEEEIPEEPAVTLEDFTDLKSLLTDMAGNEAAFYESVTVYMDTNTEAMEGISFQLSVISCALIVACAFLALMAGSRFADTFFERMRVG